MKKKSSVVNIRKEEHTHNSIGAVVVGGRPTMGSVRSTDFLFDKVDHHTH
jgi:hypothetical protein